MATAATLAGGLAAVLAPAVVAWLLLTSRTRGAGAPHREVLAGLGAGLAAAGAAALLLSAVDALLRLPTPGRLAGPVPVLEETLKALAIVAAIGPATLFAGAGLPLRRCLVATVAVVAGFATGENLGHVLPQLMAYGGGTLSGGELAGTLRVRTVLPPLGHLAEAWPAGAAIWVAARRPAGRLLARLVPLLVGVVAAAVTHAVWNLAALAWWPDPVPLLLIGAVSATGAGVFAALALRHEHADLVAGPSAGRIRPAEGPARPAVRRLPVRSAAAPAHRPDQERA